MSLLDYPAQKINARREGDELEAIGAVGEIVGATAVVATLGYLAAQIRAETSRAQREALRERSRRISDINILMADSDHLPRLLMKLSSASEANTGWRAVCEAISLDPEEAFRYTQLRQAALRSMQETLLDPTIDAITKANTLTNLRRSIRQERDAFGAFWSVLQDLFHPDFQSYVDKCLETGKPKQESDSPGDSSM